MLSLGEPEQLGFSIEWYCIDIPQIEAKAQLQTATKEKWKC